MKEYKLPYKDFIGGWFINEKVCDDIINYFNKNKNNHNIGLSTDKKIDINFKDSTDLYISSNLNESFLNNYYIELQKVLEQYIKKYSDITNLARFSVLENLSIQYYKKNQGFKSWHTENTNKQTSHRVLVFMTYLNDVKDGGTEFMYQKKITKAKKGLTLIWPAYFTHVHKGQISKKFEKYIITGFYSFE